MTVALAEIKMVPRDSFQISPWQRSPSEWALAGPAQHLSVALSFPDQVFELSLANHAALDRAHDATLVDQDQRG